jgi:hypothetical protein
MRRTSALVIAALLALPAFGQDTPDEDMRNRSDEYQDAYRRGYEKGFERGYAKGLNEGERRAVAAPAPPPPPPPPRLGPIVVINADYGSQAHRCGATRYVAKRADGKRNFSMEVTNGICGDPSPKDRKTLDVTYRCGDIEKTASAPEHRNISLDCNG